MHDFRAAFLWLSGLAAPALSQAQVSRVAASDMARALERSTESDTRGGRFTAASDGNAQFILNRRTAPSVIELHCEWDDILVVRSGAGTLTHSSQSKAPTQIGGSEWRVKSVLFPSSVDLRPGDVVRVPAGEAHQVTPLGDAPLVYLVVKTRSTNKFACRELTSAQSPRKPGGPG